MILQPRQTAVVFLVLALSLAGNFFALGKEFGTHHGRGFEGDFGGKARFAEDRRQPQKFENGKDPRHAIMRAVMEVSNRLEGAEKSEFEGDLKGYKAEAKAAFKDMRKMRRDIGGLLQKGENVDTEELSSYLQELRVSQETLQESLHKTFVRTLPYLSVDERREFVMQILRAEFSKKGIEADPKALEQCRRIVFQKGASFEPSDFQKPHFDDGASAAVRKGFDRQPEYGDRYRSHPHFKDLEEERLLEEMLFGAPIFNPGVPHHREHQKGGFFAPHPMPHKGEEPNMFVLPVPDENPDMAPPPPPALDRFEPSETGMAPPRAPESDGLLGSPEFDEILPPPDGDLHRP